MSGTTTGSSDSGDRRAAVDLAALHEQVERVELDAPAVGRRPGRARRAAPDPARESGEAAAADPDAVGGADEPTTEEAPRSKPSFIERQTDGVVSGEDFYLFSFIGAVLIVSWAVAFMACSGIGGFVGGLIAALAPPITLAAVFGTGYVGVKYYMKWVVLPANPPDRGGPPFATDEFLSTKEPSLSWFDGFVTAYEVPADGALIFRSGGHRDGGNADFDAEGHLISLEGWGYNNAVYWDGKIRHLWQWGKWVFVFFLNWKAYAGMDKSEARATKNVACTVESRSPQRPDGKTGVPDNMNVNVLLRGLSVPALPETGDVEADMRARIEQVVRLCTWIQPEMGFWGFTEPEARAAMTVVMRLMTAQEATAHQVLLGDLRERIGQTLDSDHQVILDAFADRPSATLVPTQQLLHVILAARLAPVGLAVDPAITDVAAQRQVERADTKAQAEAASAGRVKEIDAWAGVVREAVPVVRELLRGRSSD